MGGQNLVLEAYAEKYSNNRNQIKETKNFKNKIGLNLNLIL